MLKSTTADYINHSNAKIAGMKEDLDLDGKSYAWLLTIFYISYTVFEFQAMMWKIVKPHQWAAFVLFSWYETHVQCCHSTGVANV